MRLKPDWQAAPSQLTIEENEVHIWRSPLDLPEDRVQKLKNLLSEDEIQRGDRFYKIEHQNRFVVCRAILRTILSRYLHVTPNELQFEYGNSGNQSGGKPRLAEKCGGDWLQFNLSHSHNLAVYGITKHHPVGIDLEYLRPFPNAIKIAERFFSQAEYQAIKSLSDREQLRAFYQIWTVKEAYLKATGEGIVGGLDQIEVSLSYNQTERLSTRINDSSSDWNITNFIPAANYTSTVAVKMEEKSDNFIDYSYMEIV